MRARRVRQEVATPPDSSFKALLQHEASQKTWSSFCLQVCGQRWCGWIHYTAAVWDTAEAEAEVKAVAVAAANGIRATSLSHRCANAQIKVGSAINICMSSFKRIRMGSSWQKLNKLAVFISKINETFSRICNIFIKPYILFFSFDRSIVLQVQLLGNTCD